MIDEIANGSKADAKDLLLEEYRNLSDCFWKNEQSGETRVNLFIGLVTAGVGGLVALASAEHGPRGEPLRMVIITSLSVLVVLGVVTLFRMLTRNEATDRYKRGAQVIRQLFKDHFDSAYVLLHYYPFGAPKDNNNAIAIRKIGGLTHTVAVVNSVLVAGFAGAVVYPYSEVKTPGSLAWTYVCSAGVFCLGVILQFAYVNKRERRARDQGREGQASHAGGIVHRLKDDTVQYLLVGPKEDVPEEWLLPKGHIEHGEGHGEAALREVREETGVVAQLVCFVGRAEFDAPQKKESVRAKYYLMEALFETSRSESRRVDWFKFPDAQRLLTHATDKYLLHVAEKERTKHVSHDFHG